jgi:hypothetical protein
MRALLSILCLFMGAPDDGVADELKTARDDRADEYRAVLSEISFETAPEANASERPAPHDLPESIRNAIEAWTRS